MERISYTHNTVVKELETANWLKVGNRADFPDNGGLCFKHEDLQIAVFNFTSRNEWYACQNLCPHKMQMILSRGMVGSLNGEPKVACPFHKKSFSLKTGECLNGDDCSIVTFPVKEVAGAIYVELSQRSAIAI